MDPVRTGRVLSPSMAADDIDVLFIQREAASQRAWRDHEHAKFVVVDGGRGRAVFADGGPGAALAPGDCMLVPPRLRHDWRDDAADPLRFIACCFRPARFGGELRDWCRERFRRERSRALRRIGRRMVAERSLQLPGWSSKLWALLGEGLVDWQRQSLAATPVSDAVATARDHLMTHYQEPLRIAELAALAGCAYRTLTQRFKAETGLTCQAFHRRVRIRMARELLGAGWSILETALHVGYQDLGHFYRAFKAETGLRPGDVVAAPHPARL